MRHRRLGALVLVVAGGQPRDERGRGWSLAGSGRRCRDGLAAAGCGRRLPLVSTHPWQFRGTDEWSRLDVVERDRNIHHAWQQLERDEGAVIELPPAPTRDERLRALRASGLAVEVPPDRVPLWMAAYDREREALGLGSMRKPVGTP